MKIFLWQGVNRRHPFYHLIFLNAVLLKFEAMFLREKEGSCSGLRERTRLGSVLVLERVYGAMARRGSLPFKGPTSPLGLLFYKSALQLDSGSRRCGGVHPRIIFL